MSDEKDVPLPAIEVDGSLLPPSHPEPLDARAPEPLPDVLPDGILGVDGWAHFGVRLYEGDTYEFERATKDGCAELGGGLLMMDPVEIDWAHFRTLSPAAPTKETEK